MCSADTSFWKEVRTDNDPCTCDGLTSATMCGPELLPDCRMSYHKGDQSAGPNAPNLAEGYGLSIIVTTDGVARLAHFLTKLSHGSLSACRVPGEERIVKSRRTRIALRAQLGTIRRLILHFTTPPLVTMLAISGAWDAARPCRAFTRRARIAARRRVVTPSRSSSVRAVDVSGNQRADAERNEEEGVAVPTPTLMGEFFSSSSSSSVVTSAGGCPSARRHPTLSCPGEADQEGRPTDAPGGGKSSKPRGGRARVAVLGTAALTAITVTSRCQLAVASTLPPPRVASSATSSAATPTTLTSGRGMKSAGPVAELAAAMPRTGGGSNGGGARGSGAMDGGTRGSLSQVLAGVSAQAKAKFAAQWYLYCTIPVVAGVLNYLTNALAVKMIFSPEEYVGIDFKRWPETPAGLFGWQGIVPCKVRKMSTTMVDLMTKRLLDVRAVFGRLDKETCGRLLEPGIDAIAGKLAGQLTGPGGQLEWARKSGALGWVPLNAVESSRRMARRQGRELVAAVLGEMQDRVPEVWDVKTQVVGAMTRDKKIIVELFQRCGREEFIFIKRSGLYFGFLFGVLQMLQWLVWDPWWSLAVGGALVGYATDWLALKLMFEPVNPVALPFGFTLHGAFLRRQMEVSGEFATLLRTRILTAELIWREILTSEKTKAVFAEILERKTREQISKARKSEAAVKAAAAVLGPRKWQEVEDLVVERVAADLPSHLPLVYAYSDEALDLEATLREKMQGLSGEEFEGVLHPVFQEDELTLILVGAFLGLMAGFGQALFF